MSVGNVIDRTAKTSPSASSPDQATETASCQWLVTTDGSEHLVRFWDGEPGAPVVIYLHGIEGHSRWFEPTALFLNKQGITVAAIDRRGAGASKETRGDIAAYKRLVDDADELLCQIAQHYPGCPLFLAANCWGAKVGIVVAGRRDIGKRLQGMVLTSPAVATQVVVSLGTKLRIGLDYLLGGGLHYFAIPLTVQHFTDNPAYLEFIENDQLRLTEATARFFVESLKLTRACRQAAPLLRLPVLVMQSGRDAIVQMNGLQQWFKSVGSSDKTLKIFTSAAHSLDFEADPTDYQGLLAQWIVARCG